MMARSVLFFSKELRHELRQIIEIDFKLVNHIHDGRHPISTSVSRCSTGRSNASKKTSFTPKISHFMRLKTLVAAAFFGYLFFAVDHIYWINMEQL
jgi:hypothetical protein